MRRAALAAFFVLAVLAVSPSSAVGEDRIVRGQASTYGGSQYEGLFALPRSLGGRGERVRVCSPVTGRCIVRTSNDVGPVARLHRVADLDATDFNYLCACRWQTRGTQPVTIRWLSGRSIANSGRSTVPPPTAPPTDTIDGPSPQDGRELGNQHSLWPTAARIMGLGFGVLALLFGGRYLGSRHRERRTWRHAHPVGRRFRQQA